MAVCPDFVFDNITDAAWRGIVAAMGADPAEVAAAGSTEKMGVTVAWRFDEAAGQLTITCMAKPFIVSCAIVEAQVRGLVQAGLARAVG